MRRGPLSGTTMGNYVLAEMLDEGGVGSVYVAEHRFLGERAAVKVLHQQPQNVDAEEIARRFFQEARATRSIDHPNVLKVLDFGQNSDGTLYLAMELLEGVTIASVLKRTPIEERSAAVVASAVASGLHAAHEKGIIHRDLKPANIFLCKNGRVRLLDFGMAKVKDGRVRTGVGLLAGTPQYMSPEQIRQAPDIGPKADIYGLGAVLFKMLTGRLPFESDSLQEIVRMHLTESPPKPSQFAKVSERMDAIVLACMEKEPAKRPASMLELRELLRPIAEQVGPEVMARTADAQNQPEMVVPAAAALLSPAAASPAKAQPKRGWGMMALLLLVVIGLAAGAAALRPWSQSQSLSPAEPASPPVAAPPLTQPQAAAPQPTAPKSAERTVLLVESDPTGAEVFVDHVDRGMAPLEVTVPIPFELKLTMDGYRTVRKKITKPGPVKIKLVPSSDSVALPAAPAAEPEGKLPPE